jgi:CRP-like cAMP-binding protein
MELLDYLKHRTQVSTETGAVLDELFVRKHVSKGHQLLEENNLSKKIFFFEVGLARTYYSIDRDITHLFFAENSFMAPVDSVYYSRPSPYAVQILEDTIVRAANFIDFQVLIEKDIMLQRLAMNLLVDTVMLLSDRLYSIQFQSAQQRYHSLVKKHPDILRRAPLGTIASYLGITQQTLSVIRAEK